MRPLLVIGAIGCAVYMLFASGAEAAVIHGRVIDSVGQPASGPAAMLSNDRSYLNPACP